MITKGMRDIFGVREMFQIRAVVTAAQLSKVSPHGPVQPVRASLRLTAGRLNEHWVLDPDAQLGTPPRGEVTGTC